MEAVSARYTIERHEHGWLVRGEVPVADITWIFRLIPTDGIADARISSALGGSLALTTYQNGASWRKALGV